MEYSEDYLVCDKCGSLYIEVKAWVNPNTFEYIGGAEDTAGEEQWCNECRTPCSFCTLQEFEERMNSRWDSLHYEDYLKIAQSYSVNCDYEENPHTLEIECASWWNALDYEAKRSVYVDIINRNENDILL